MCKNKRKISKCTLMHYIKFFLRGALFLFALVMYILAKVYKSEYQFFGVEKHYWLAIVVWVMFLIEIILRFVPNKLESLGCQKQHKSRFIPTNESKPKLESWVRTFLFAFTWIGVNLIFGVIYLLGYIDKGILVLLVLAYGISDMFCILFFCPIQSWYFRNRCCNDCRIYNWDFAMMFTPFIFIPHYFTWSLLGLSIILLIVWEVVYKIHPERFAHNTNAGISCENCREQLCFHKKQLRRLWKKTKRFIFKETDIDNEDGRK